MSTPAAGSTTERFVGWAARAVERRVSRRGLLARATLVGTAVSAVGWDFVVRPGTAYAWVCGDGASCYSGWTAMCCTINSGVNQCPPGSFAGGWWKAEGASLCGGKARYYVDCQAECGSCGCHGSHFCGERCWSCRPHCADDGGCDRRRVCHTVFRYGQCNQHRECSGPVMCRAISCTPPWQWAECTTTAATSQATVAHSAPCLPGWSVISERYTNLGSQGSVLGASVGGEEPIPRGRMQRYVDGRMYYSATSGAHFLTGEVLACYRRLLETESPVGFPVSDSGPVFGTTGQRLGAGATFEHGGIFQRPGFFGYAVWGAVYERYQELGGVRGELGFPTATQFVTPDDNAYAYFDNGALYHKVGTPPYLLTGVTAAKYLQLGEVTGPLGYPTSESTDVINNQGEPGTQVSFDAGAITVVDDVAYAVWGPIFTAWSDQGGAGGTLGFPISDVIVGGVSDVCQFENGSMTLDHSTGVVTTTPTASTSSG